MDIRSKIASFEAHNQQVRATSVPASHPTARTPTREAPTARTPTREALTARTTTREASQNRRERLAREANELPARMMNKGSTPSSLAERRRARQLQKQKRLSRETNSSPITEDNNSKTVSRSSSESSPAQRRTKALPEASPISNVSSSNVSMDSSRSYDDDNLDDIPLSPDRRLSPARAAKAHRGRRKQQQRPESAPDHHHMPEYEHSEPPTDDEVTLTSVRQIMQPGEGGGLNLSASSSTIGTDVKDLPPTNTQAFLSARAAFGDDERTFDYGERDAADDDDESVTFEQRKEAARKAKEAEKTRKEGFVDGAKNPLLNTEDVSYYRQTLDTPAAKVTGGLVAAGTIGCLLLGPVGLLVGAAAVGIGVGVMQIPEEQRAHVRDKAVKTAHQAKESVVNASEVLSSSCAAGCHDLGVADHLPSDVKEFFENPDPKKKKGKDEASVMNGVGTGVERSKDVNGPSPGGNEGRKPPKLMNQSPSKTGKRRAACLRNCKPFGRTVDVFLSLFDATCELMLSRFSFCLVARIVPVDQIYSLEPSLQPRAWLDVMASANTSQDQKNEGMEEILILAKDKRHARFFLEEGILDSLMCIIMQYLDSGPERKDEDAFLHAKLAASCCVTLGKAHCAAVHTEGDLQLMSLYERGTVPEERQLAQMLHEVPHHVQVALSPTEDIFVIKQMSITQAEEMARSIMPLAQGKKPEISS